MSRYDVTDYDMHEATPLEKEIIQRAGLTLIKNFPFVTWDVSFEQGILKVKCPELYEFENRNYGFNVPYAHIHTDGDWERKLRDAGGTLLDAAWTSTETGQRIKDHVDKPNDGS